MNYWSIEFDCSSFLTHQSYFPFLWHFLCSSHFSHNFYIFCYWYKQIAIGAHGLNGENSKLILKFPPFCVWERINSEAFLVLFFTDEWWYWNISFSRGGQHIFVERNNLWEQRYSFWRNRIQAISFLPHRLSL